MARVLERVFGPRKLGGGISTWTEKRITNVRVIFAKAVGKLGQKIDSEGAVPPKVLKGILDDGSFVDDALASEYFAGVH